VEHGGGGGAAAAPMAREMFRLYFDKRKHPEIVTQTASRAAAGEAR
jgi:hypothetical protein